MLQKVNTISLQFTETMHGHFTDNRDLLKIDNTKLSFQKCKMDGESLQQDLKFYLTIYMEDIDKFCNDPKLTADATGYVDCPALGGRLEVEKGIFNLFVRPTSSAEFNAAKEMHYTLFFKDQNGNPKTFYGYKVVERHDYDDAWEETTTLFTTLWDGHLEEFSDVSKLIGKGILRLNISDFAKQMGTFKANGGNFVQRSVATLKFLGIFAENLWEAYAPSFFFTDSSHWDEHLFPLETTEGVKDCDKSSIRIHTDDGLALSIERFKRSDSKDVVVLLHGLTTSTDMFIMPEHYNLVQYLLDNKYEDVFSIDWRGSNRHNYNLIPNRYSVDDCIMYDVPKAFQTIREQVGPDVNIHVICHCVGSISFMGALGAGLVDDIKSVISNSVSYTPKVRKMTKLKLAVAPFALEYIFRYPYISPKIPYMPGAVFGRWMPLMERLIRKECDEPACHMLSFMWGWGFPACYLHENIHPITHRRLADLFGGVTVNYFRHIRKCAFKNETVPFKKEGKYSNLPASYLQNTKNVDLPPIMFISGEQNLIFPESNLMSHKRILEINPDAPVEYKEYPNYGHQDVFMGKNCDKDIFPSFIDFLNKNKGQ